MFYMSKVTLGKSPSQINLNNQYIPLSRDQLAWKSTVASEGSFEIKVELNCVGMKEGKDKCECESEF